MQMLSITLNPNSDFCPCERGRLIRDCCGQANGKLRAKPSKVNLQGPKTGFAHTRCYFSALNDCSKEITSEHYISHAILKVLAENGLVSVSGLPWQEETPEKAKVPPQRLVSKVLCGRHNAALSPLDSVALRFFNKFLSIASEFRDDHLRTLQRLFLFNGHDIERWMLKTICSSVASKNASSQQGPILDWSPNQSWLKTILGKKTFPPKCGMYFSIATDGVEIKRAKGFVFAPLSNSNLGGVYGGLFTLNGYDFLLTMARPPENKTGTIFVGHTLRPVELQMEYLGVKKTVLLTWDVQGENRAIKSTYVDFSPA